MKRSLGRRPLEVKFAFILAVTLLLPGVTSRSIVSTTTSPDVTSGPTVGNLEEEPAPDKFELEPNSEEEDSTEHDDTMEDHDIEAVSDINSIETTDLGESPLVNNETETNDESDEDDALTFFTLLAKRAADEETSDDSEEDESETNSVDEDKFSISDLPKLLKPLIDAFSDQSNSEAPSKDDFLSWFPSLKDLFEPKKPKGSEATNSSTRSGRRSSVSAASGPSLQTSPLATQSPEHEILPSSQPDDLIVTVTTITRPPITITEPPVSTSERPITINPSEDSDSEEDPEMDY
ncbi:uncharacterized protein LOC132572294 [Heteronotia binoei]|uniref:uncharacterized protein LOC132572293 n=1 Tax=Heteronotia binoei TaxID=13085 RepID=UPI0029317907|nr:uncharacterized protein LOC132572293 [Heteronotia binoei]XP_060095173.1 uncharacterized protein LOC132572294 [Heteronotia binoei]